MTSQRDKDELMKAFSALDADGNGILSREELISGYKQIYPSFTETKIIKTVDDLMDQVDVNKRGNLKIFFWPLKI
jgi:Ca2+-binding EF-hand superfamily protein